MGLPTFWSCRARLGSDFSSFRVGSRNAVLSLPVRKRLRKLRIAIVDSSEGGLMWCFFVTRSPVCRRIMGCYGLQTGDPACSGPSAESIPTSPLVLKLHL